MQTQSLIKSTIHYGIIHPIIVLAIENMHLQSNFYFKTGERSTTFTIKMVKHFLTLFLFQFVSYILTCILCVYIMSSCIPIYLMFASHFHALMCLLRVCCLQVLICLLHALRHMYSFILMYNLYIEFTRKF